MKQYIKPQIQVIHIQSSYIILAGSGRDELPTGQGTIDCEGDFLSKDKHYDIWDNADY